VIGVPAVKVEAGVVEKAKVKVKENGKGYRTHIGA